MGKSLLPTRREKIRGGKVLDLVVRREEQEEK